MSEQLCILGYYVYYKYWLKFSDRTELERWQQTKLKRHFRFIAKNSVLYKGIRDIKAYPKIDKEFMMRNFDKLNTVNINRTEAEQFAVKAEKERNFVPKLRGITIGLSSGTSGKRGIFLVSEAERIRWAGYILARLLPGSILNFYSIAFFMRADSNLYQSLGSNRIQFHFFDIYQDIKEYGKRLEHIKPQILVGQPSVLLILAKEKEQGHLNIAPQRIISIAEVLEKDDEKWLKKIFDLKVIHQVYQCTEGCLATTCKYGTLHLNEDIVHIEREYLDEYRFVPVVTDFERKAQPIIRYRLNDILVESRRKCRCGSHCLALDKIEGREDDVFSFPGKDEIEKIVFPDFIRRCMLFADHEGEEDSRIVIKEPKGNTRRDGDYRVVQEVDGRITVYSNLTENEKQRVRKEFRKLSEEQGWILPEINFQPYVQEKEKKMKRVERENGLKIIK